MAERESNEVHICSCETSRLSENSKPADGTPKNLAELEILYSDLIRKLQSEIGEFSDIGVCVSCKKAGRKMQRLELISKAYNERGQLKYLQVNFDGALKDYSSSLDFMLNPVALYNRATIYYRLCNYDLAVLDLQETLKLKPDFEDAKQALDSAQHAQQLRT